MWVFCCFTADSLELGKDSTDSTEEFFLSDEITHKHVEKWEIEANSSPVLAAGEPATQAFAQTISGSCAMKL